jgi:hypothetical protein
MRRMAVAAGVVGLLVLCASWAFSQPGMFFLPPATRVAYSISPPRSITVVIPKTTLYVDLRKDGQLQLNSDLPQAGSTYGYGAVLINICSQWELYGTYPGAKQYQVRPAMDLQVHWVKYALHIDVPTLSWGTPLGTAVTIIPQTAFGTVPAPTQKFPIVPAPSITLGPLGMQGAIPQPTQADITFPSVTLEWFRWSGKARFRAGNVVLLSDVGWRWHETNPNAIYIGNFLIDLAAGTVTYVNWKAGGTLHPTLLPVTMDDSVGDIVPFEFDLWW